MANIIGTTPDGYDYRYSAHGLTGVTSGVNQYVFAAEGAEGGIGDQKLHVLKSTDGGATWSDVANATLGAVPAFCICQDGDTVYILSTETSNGGFGVTVCAAIVGWTFTLSTDSLASLSLSSAPTVNKFWHGAVPNGYQISKCVGLSLVRRAAGSFWFLFQGAPFDNTTDKWARVYVCSFDGTTFGSPAILSGQSGTTGFTQGGAAIDSSGNLHVILAETTSRKYHHLGMDSVGGFGTFQDIETDCFFVHLDPPEEISNLLIFDDGGEKLGFVGVNNHSSTEGDITFYYAPATLSPTWSTAAIQLSTSGPPVVIDANMGSGLSTALGEINGTLYAFWTVSGVTDTWRVVDRIGRIETSHTQGSLSFWSLATDHFVAPAPVPPIDGWSAAIVNVWPWTSDTLAIFLGFTGAENDSGGHAIELSYFDILQQDTPTITIIKSDTLALADTAVANFVTGAGADASDAIMFSDGPPQLGLSVISNPADNIVPLPPGTGTPGPDVPPIGLSTCIFEFYEMQKPEDVEVLPVPKRYDQLGPMRFDKIGKIFALRIRMIVNGTTTSMPYAIYGDDSETSPHLNSALFADSFAVRPGFDNVYEIQLPKSVNTDVFRLTLGPVADSFHRYNVIVKVHISGMQGQAKWLPIR